MLKVNDNDDKFL